MPENVRQIPTHSGVIILQWNKNSTLLKVWFTESFIQTIDLKNLIKLRGYLREYSRDTREMVRNTGMKTLVITDERIFGHTRLSLVTHPDEIKATIRFIAGVSGSSIHGYLTMGTVQRLLKMIGQSIILLSEEHYLKQCVETYGRNWRLGI